MLLLGKKIISFNDQSPAFIVIVCLFLLLFRRKLSGGKFGGGGGGENGGNKTSLDSVNYNKEEEEERLKALMRDDFIDDLKSGDCVPVQLPMVDTGKIFRYNLKIS